MAKTMTSYITDAKTIITLIVILVVLWHVPQTIGFFKNNPMMIFFIAMAYLVTRK